MGKISTMQIDRARKTTLYIPEEVVYALCGGVRYDDILNFGQVCRSTHMACAHLMRTRLARRLRLKSEEPAIQEVVDSLTSVMDCATVKKAFRASITDVCVTCLSDWAGEENARLGKKLCCACFDREDFAPVSAQTKGRWVPLRELEMRGLLHAIPRDTAARKAYQTVRKPEWQRTLPSHFVRTRDVEQVGAELFGDLVPEAKRKTIYRRYEATHRRMKDAAWEKIMAVQPHMQTIVDFTVSLKVGQVNAFIASVHTTYQENGHFWLSSKGRFAPEYYGNSLIPGMTHSTKTVQKGHVDYTKHICRICAQALTRS
jgi:hypothetical protein